MVSPVKCVVALDSFKGTLTSREACDIVAEALSSHLPGCEVVKKPMADGGEGTARALIDAGGGTWVTQTVMGPLPGMEVEAGFAWFDDTATALVEMAAASGLELLTKEQMNPLETTTFGTGQLIKAALDHGARRVLLAIGGSATVDGGVGAAMALGWTFKDEQGETVPLGGGGLERIVSITAPPVHEIVPVEILCDVDNPLLGERGAAKIYGPQKGATPGMVEYLERGLSHLAGQVELHLKRDVRTIPGAGAAGGLGAGALAFMDGKAVSGIETVMEISNLETELGTADWVLTGEGSFDYQSLMGKVVSGILKMAARAVGGPKVAVIAGQVSVSSEEYRRHGIEVAVSCRSEGMALEYALENCRSLLEKAAGRLASEYLAPRVSGGH